jgi:hypothetical protein
MARQGDNPFPSWIVALPSFLVMKKNGDDLSRRYKFFIIPLKALVLLFRRHASNSKFQQ